MFSLSALAPRVIQSNLMWVNDVYDNDTHIYVSCQMSSKLQTTARIIICNVAYIHLFVLVYAYHPGVLINLL